MPEWNADLRSDELTAAGCWKVHVDHAFSTLDRRPQLDRLLEGLPRGDTLVVWRWAPLGRSLRHLIDTAVMVGERNIGFRSLAESIVTITGVGCWCSTCSRP